MPEAELGLVNLFTILKNNEDNMTIFARYPESVREAIRYNWDKLVQTTNFMKFGFEGWRRCKDHGPQPHVVYCIAEDNTATLSPRKDLDQSIKLNGVDIEKKFKDIEDRITSLEKALSFLICETGCNGSEIKNTRPFHIIKPTDIAYILGLSKD